MLTLGRRGRPSLQAPFNHPADVAVSPAGEIYVADGYGNSSVHRFSAEGGTWARGARRAPGAGSSRRPTASGSTRRTASSSPIGRTTASSCSARRATTTASGGTSTIPWTSMSTRPAPSTSPTRFPASACTPRTGDSWRAAGRSTWAPTASGATREGDLYLAEVGLNQVTKLARRLRPHPEGGGPSGRLRRSISDLGEARPRHEGSGAIAMKLAVMGVRRHRRLPRGAPSGGRRRGDVPRARRAPRGDPRARALGPEPSR